MDNFISFGAFKQKQVLEQTEKHWNKISKFKPKISKLTLRYDYDIYYIHVAPIYLNLECCL